MPMNFYQRSGKGEGIDRLLSDKDIHKQYDVDCTKRDYDRWPKTYQVQRTEWFLQIIPILLELVARN